MPKDRVYTIEEARKIVKELSTDIAALDYQYYVLSDSRTPDHVYDFKMKELQKLEVLYPDLVEVNSPTRRVGSDSVAGFSKVRHTAPMLSIDNVYSIEDLNQFLSRTVSEVGATAFSAELKYDGAAIRLTYKNGRLVQAVTRGDGTVGDDVTTNVMAIKSVPLVLRGASYPDFLEVSGEIILPKAELVRINKDRLDAGEQPLANCRSVANGTLKTQDSKIVAARNLECYVYNAVTDFNINSQFTCLLHLKEWGFKVFPASVLPLFSMKRHTSATSILSFIMVWQNYKNTLPFDIDGIVIKIDELDKQVAMGTTAKHYRYAIAYKYKSEAKSTKMLGVSFQVSRYGSLTPVALLEGVEINGTIIKRATLNNEDWLIGMDLRWNDYVFVEKGGEVIPNVVSVDLSKRTGDDLLVSFPTQCPCCKTAILKRFSSGGIPEYICPNYSCFDQVVSRIEHFVSKAAMNISGIGIETVKLFVRTCIVKDIADLYDVTPEMLLDIGVSSNTAHTLVAAIQDSLGVPFDRVLFAISIPTVGTGTAKELVEKAVNIDNLMVSRMKLLSSGIATDSVSQSLQEFFSSSVNLTIISRLRSYGLQFEGKTLGVLSSALIGKKIVVSGNFGSTERRTWLEESIALHGGVKQSSVNGNTSFIVGGDKIGPEKKRKADELGIKVFTEKEYLALIDSKTF